MTEANFEATQFTGIGCASVENVELPSASSAFFNPTEGSHRIRFLQGPVISYISQIWEDGKPFGEKIKYDYNDPAAKKDPNAKLVMIFLIYCYEDKTVKLWEIGQSSILKHIKKVNEMQPDLSAFDIQVTKTKRQGTQYYDYTIVQGQNKPFTDAEAIAEVVERGLKKRLADINKTGEGDTEEQQQIEQQIAAATPATTAAPAKTAATPQTAEEVFQ